MAAKETKLSKKDLNQPDAFQSRGEQILDHLVKYKARYFAAAGSILAIILAVVIVRAWLTHRTEGISQQFAEAMKAYHATVAEKKDPAAKEKKDDLTFPSEEARNLEAQRRFQTIVDQYGSTSYGQAARFYIAHTHFRLKNYAKARELYETFLKDSGSDFAQFKFIALHNVAQCHYGEGNLDKALEIYNQILKEDGASFKDEATYQIAAIYRRQGKTDDAVKWLKELKEKYADSPLKGKADKLLTILRGPEEVKASGAGEEAGEPINLELEP